ncbi:hypothetical protein BDV10DRAFT_189560 [Aspergillus recurvatus]
MGHWFSRQRRREVASRQTNPPEPYDMFSCVVCGALIYKCDNNVQDSILASRENWKGFKLTRRNKDIVVAASEVEETYLEGPLAWSYLYRVILEDPDTKHLSLAGITTSREGLFVPTDHKSARIASITREEREWQTPFWPIDLTGASCEPLGLAPQTPQQQQRKKKSKRKDSLYPSACMLHADCWLLVDKVVGHSLVLDNLRPFVQALEDYWKSNRNDWARSPGHRHDWTHPTCEGWRMPKFQPDEWFRPKPCLEIRFDYRMHQPRSPLRIPEIRALVDSVCRQQTPGEDMAIRRRPVSDSLVKVDVPVDIAIMIIDYICHKHPSPKDMIQDTRSILEAFHWRLPDTYWISRCNPGPLLELEETQPESHVDWAALCLGLEELLIEPHWYCRSGLKLRVSLLESLGIIKSNFFKRVETQNGRPAAVIDRNR